MAHSIKRKRINKEINKVITSVFEAIVSDIEEEAGRYKKKHWVRPFLQLRKERGDFYVAIPDMLREDPGYFVDTFRMTPSGFEELLTLVGPKLEKNNFGREPLPPAERLLMTLAYLVSGDEQKSIAKDYRVGKSTICNVIREVCDCIYEVLKSQVLKPLSKGKLRQVASRYQELWNFGQCIGSIDGKHFRIPKPENSGSQYYNYKGYHSVIMLAICDADYNFTYVNVGAAGSESDGGIFRRCEFGKQLVAESLDLPESKKLLDSNFVAPPVLVGDEAFPLLINLMRPYSGRNLTMTQRIFNYRLSRARRIIENVFGILVARWRLLGDTINMKPENVTKAILACVVLHNWIRSKAELRFHYTPAGFVDSEDSFGQVNNGSWRGQVSGSQDGLSPRGNNPTVSAKLMRDKFAEYFATTGAVPWQNERIIDY